MGARDDEPQRAPPSEAPRRYHGAVRARLGFVSLLVTAFGCGGPAPTVDAGAPAPVVLDVLAPDPALQGSILEVRVLHGDALGAHPQLTLEEAGAPIGTLDAAPGGGDGTLLFPLTAGAADRLGAGMHSIDARLVGGGVLSAPYPFALTVAASLPVSLAEVPSGEVYRNDVQVLTGDGMVSATEGDVTARFSGTFTLDGGGASPIDVSLPVAPLEARNRGRGVVVLTTDLGGLMPGTFEGTIQLDSTLRSGEHTESDALPTTLHFNPPALFGLDPTMASLGQILRVRGGGFLGGADRPNETTLIRLEGSFTPSGGGAAEPFAAMELVPRFVSGSEVQLVIEAEERDGALIASLFGHARGSFAGTATPVAIAGTDELHGNPVPFAFTLGPVTQVVWLRFLPGFVDSLRRFGLASAERAIVDGVKARMDGIYADWNVDVRLEEPDDFAQTAYSVVEIGGPDPNGVGLFGYDNTPGKDVGNLRLFDAIGGTNAETQMDGYPGFGGVFVDSFLYWSSHPELPGNPPTGAPDPEPRFDEVFDPVRAQPATLAEVQGEGDAARVAAVRRAVGALAAIIGETASHELGHSLGLAQPYGPPTVYHNDFDGEGCLMDSGGDRPLGERMGEDGFTPTHFCYDHPDYLTEILAVR